MTVAEELRADAADCRAMRPPRTRDAQWLEALAARVEAIAERLRDKSRTYIEQYTIAELDEWASELAPEKEEG